MKFDQASLKVLWVEESRCVAFTIGSLLSLLVSVMLGWGYLAVMSAAVLFAGFDRLGFNKVLRASEEAGAKPAYRILQTIFQVLVAFVLGGLGWVPVLGFLFLWWTGACDYLYYALAKEDYPKWDHLPWLWWTWPALLGVPGKEFSADELRVYSWLSIALVSIFYIFF